MHVCIYTHTHTHNIYIYIHIYIYIYSGNLEQYGGQGCRPSTQSKIPIKLYCGTSISMVPHLRIQSTMNCAVLQYMGLARGLPGKESVCNAGNIGDSGSIPGSERSPRGGHGNPLQYSCLENPRDRRAWWATVHGVTKSCTRLKPQHARTHTRSTYTVKKNQV